VSLIYSCINHLKIVLVLFFLVLITGCIAEDKEDKNPINSVGEEVDDTSLELNGFWNGGFDGAESLRVLINNGDLYGLDTSTTDAKAFFGTIESPSNEILKFDLLSYPLAMNDPVNKEFIADGSATQYIADSALLVNSKQIVGTFSIGNIGTPSDILLENDETFSNNQSVASLAKGQWTTSVYSMFISVNGNFVVSSSDETKRCNFTGNFSNINTSNSLLAININREGCVEFNGDSLGFAAINAEGELEIYSKMGSSLLFMTFTAPASSGNTSIPEVPAEEASAVDEVATP
jgi:hypothetical protein